MKTYTGCRYDAIAGLAKMENNKTMIDCACGGGKNGNNTILDKFTPARYICVDIDEDIIKECRKNTNNRADRYICADKLELVLKEQFDYYLCVETLEHLEEKNNQRTANAISNLIKVGGKLLITVPGNKIVAMESPLHKQFVTKDKLLILYNSFELEAEAKYLKNEEKSNRYNSLYIFRKIGD